MKKITKIITLVTSLAIPFAGSAYAMRLTLSQRKEIISNIASIVDQAIKADSQDQVKKLFNELNTIKEQYKDATSKNLKKHIGDAIETLTDITNTLNANLSSIIKDKEEPEPYFQDDFKEEKVDYNKEEKEEVKEEEVVVIKEKNKEEVKKEVEGEDELFFHPEEDKLQKDTLDELLKNFFTEEKERKEIAKELVSAVSISSFCALNLATNKFLDKNQHLNFNDDQKLGIALIKTDLLGLDYYNTVELNPFLRILTNKESLFVKHFVKASEARNKEIANIKNELEKQKKIVIEKVKVLKNQEQTIQSLKDQLKNKKKNSSSPKKKKKKNKKKNK